MTQDIGLKKIAEGNEAEIFDFGNGRVLRLFRDPAAKAWFEWEIQAMRAVRAVVPLVPEVFETTEVDGRPGIVMERVDGIDLLTRVGQKPWTVFAAGKVLGETHARLHDVVAPPEIQSLRDRALALRTRVTTELIPPEMLAWGLAELEKMPDGDRLLHGDFHPANVLMSSKGPIVIDWPNVTRGHPDADVARTVLMIRIGEVPPGSSIVIRQGARFVRKMLLSSYLRAYRARRPIAQGVIERWIGIRAVDRLAENLKTEREALLAIVAKARAAG